MNSSSKPKILLINKILLIINSVLLVCLYFSTAMPIYLKRATTFDNTIKLVVAFTQQGVQVGDGISNVNFLGIVKYDYELSKYVMGNKISVGRITGKIYPWGKNIAEIVWARDIDYIFKTPDENMEDKLYDDSVWQRLERLPSDTICEMAFSFEQYYDLKNIPKISAENIDIVWYVLDTGNHEIMKQIQQSSPTTYFGVDKYYWIHNVELETNKSTFKEPLFPEGYLDKVAWLTKHTDIFQIIAPSVQREIPINQRYQYLEEHGLKTYGIIVQGPVKELLRLRDTTQFCCPQFRDIALDPASIKG